MIDLNEFKKQVVEYYLKNPNLEYDVLFDASWFDEYRFTGKIVVSFFKTHGDNILYGRVFAWFVEAITLDSIDIIENEIRKDLRQSYRKQWLTKWRYTNETEKAV